MVEVSQYYFTGNYLFGKDKSHTVGLLAHVKDRGNLISKTSLKLAYRKKIKLNYKSELSMSSHVGMYHFYLESTQITPGGRDAALDLGVSIAYQTKTFLLSSFFGNITKPSLVLYQESIVYMRYLVFFLQNNLCYLKGIRVLCNSIFMVKRATYQKAVCFGEEPLTKKSRRIYLLE